MAENPLDEGELLRRALHGYAGRFEPVQDQWARIEGRYAAVTLRSRPRRSLISLAATALVAAVVVLVAAILVRPDQVRPPVAQAFVEPDMPQYAGVVPVPVHPAGSTMAGIQDRGFIRVGIKFDQPSFGEEDPATHEVQGFDSEIAKLLAVGIFGGRVSDLGDKVRWVQAVTKNRESLLQEGVVDVVVATYTITALRAQTVDFAGPYYVAHQDIMVRANDGSIGGVEDLSGKRVCTAQGSTSYQNLVKRNPMAEVVVRDTYSECAAALLDGQVDAVTTDQGILAGYYHQSGGTFEIANKPFSDEPYGVGLRKGDDEFRSFLDDRLAHIVGNGDWGRAARYSLSGIESIPPSIPGR